MSELEPKHENGFGKFNPFRIIKKATKAVPVVRYAFGLAGIISVIALIKTYGITLRVAFWGVVLTLCLMLILLLLASLSELIKAKKIQGPQTVIVWAISLIFIATILCLFTSVFFKRPLNLCKWIDPSCIVTKKDTPTQQDIKIPTAHIVIDTVIVGDKIAGIVTGIPNELLGQCKVIVYFYTNQYYIHPYTQTYQEPSSNIGTNGSWQITSVRRQGPCPSRVLAAIVRNDFVPPSEYYGSPADFINWTECKRCINCNDSIIPSPLPTPVHYNITGFWKRKEASLDPDAYFTFKQAYSETEKRDTVFMKVLEAEILNIGHGDYTNRNTISLTVNRIASGIKTEMVWNFNILNDSLIKVKELRTDGTNEQPRRLDGERYLVKLRICLKTIQHNPYRRQMHHCHTCII